MGLGWAPNRVSQLESLRRPVSLFEVAALGWVFEVPVTRLLPGDQDIEAPDRQTVIPLEHIRAALTGDTAIQMAAREADQRQRTYVEEIRRVAKNLGIEPRVLDWLSQQMYGRAFVDEREARLGDVSDLSKESARTKRGHVTRSLVGEIGQHLDREGRDKVTAAYRAEVKRIHEEVKRQLLDGRGAPADE